MQVQRPRGQNPKESESCTRKYKAHSIAQSTKTAAVFAVCVLKKGNTCNSCSIRIEKFNNEGSSVQAKKINPTSITDRKIYYKTLPLQQDEYSLPYSLGCV